MSRVSLTTDKERCWFCTHDEPPPETISAIIPVCREHMENIDKLLPGAMLLSGIDMK